MRVSDVAELIQAQLAKPDEMMSGLSSSCHWYNGFSVQMEIFTTSYAGGTRAVHGGQHHMPDEGGDLPSTIGGDQWLCERARGPSWGAAHAQPAAVHGMGDGSNYGSRRAFLVFVMGQDLVHDAASLMAAIVAPSQVVVEPQPPVGIQLAVTSELLLTCTITSCK